MIKGSPLLTLSILKMQYIAVESNIKKESRKEILMLSVNPDTGNGLTDYSQKYWIRVCHIQFNINFNRLSGNYSVQILF